MRRLALMGLCFVLLAAGCGPGATAAPTPVPPTVAQPTATAVPPTPTSVPPTPTSVPPTATLSSPLGTVPPASPTPTPRPDALFRGDAQRTGQAGAPGLRTLPAVVWEKHGLGLGVHGAPVAAGGVVYVPNQTGRLRAFDAATGEQRWLAGQPGNDNIVSSPAIVDGTVYVSLPGGLYALAAADGRERWRYPADELIYTAPLVVAETVYVSTQSGHTVALDAATGAVRWEAEIGGFVLWPMAYADGRVFVSNGNVVLALDAATGTERWQSEPAEGWAPLAVSDGRLYSGSGAGGFTALDAATGATVWQQTVDGEDWGGAAVGGGLVFAGNRNQTVYAFDAATGAPAWSFDTEDWAVSDPVLAGDVLYVGVGNHDRREGPRHLYALDAATGAELWRFQGDGRLLSAPEAAPDGTIFVLTATGSLYALR